MRTMIILFLFFLFNLNLKGQEKKIKITLIHEVDSLVNRIKKNENDQLIIYYPDGALKSGVILWKANDVNNGVSFRKVKNKFEVKNISNINIYQSGIMNQFADSFEVLKKSLPFGSYEMSHDFNLIWIYITKFSADTVYKKVSDVVGGGDQTGKYTYLKFEKLYSLSMFPLKISNRKRKFHTGNSRPK